MQNSAMSYAEHGRLYRALGEKICQARKEAQLSQGALAERLGISRASVVNVEKGRQRPPLHVLWDIAEIVQVEAFQLVPRAGEIAAADSEVHLDSEIIKQIEDAANGDAATKRRLTEFIQQTKPRPKGGR